MAIPKAKDPSVRVIISTEDGIVLEQLRIEGPIGQSPAGIARRVTSKLDMMDGSEFKVVDLSDD